LRERSEKKTTGLGGQEYNVKYFLRTCFGSGQVIRTLAIERTTDIKKEWIFCIIRQEFLVNHTEE